MPLNRNIRGAQGIERLHPGVEQRELEPAVLRDMGRKGVGPHRHELGAVVLRIRVDRIWAVDEADAQRRPLRGDANLPLRRKNVSATSPRRS
jgi:hypothetical protein